MRILFLQFTNPAGYPPLRRAMRLMNGRGWHLHSVGARSLGTATFRLPHLPLLRSETVDVPGPTAVRYAAWMTRALLKARLWRPDWIYASDALAAPAALLAGRIAGSRVVYHEHDLPAVHATGRLMQRALTARAMLARRADLVVVPGEARGQMLAEAVGGGVEPLTVWNCPLREEVLPPRSDVGPGGLRIHFQGSLGPQRLPHALLEAMAALPSSVTLTVVGYETTGHTGFGADFAARAAALGVDDRVRVIGRIPIAEMAAVTSAAHVGCMLIDPAVDEANLRTLQGPSNKVFEYMAAGLAVLVADQAGWDGLVTDPGHGVAAMLEGPAIAAALAPLAADPAQACAMGEAGRQRVLARWNYDTVFAPVLDRMSRV